MVRVRVSRVVCVVNRVSVMRPMCPMRMMRSSRPPKHRFRKRYTGRIHRRCVMSVMGVWIVRRVRFRRCVGCVRHRRSFQRWRLKANFRQRRRTSAKTARYRLVMMMMMRNAPSIHIQS